MNWLERIKTIGTEGETEEDIKRYRFTNQLFIIGGTASFFLVSISLYYDAFWGSIFHAITGISMFLSLYFNSLKKIQLAISYSIFSATVFVSALAFIYGLDSGSQFFLITIACGSLFFFNGRESILFLSMQLFCFMFLLYYDLYFGITPLYNLGDFFYLVNVVSSTGIALAVIYLVKVEQIKFEVYIKEKNNEMSKLNDELKLLNENLMHANRQIAEGKKELQLLNATLEIQVAERIEEINYKNEKLKQVAFMNSHNLRKPVANLIGLVDVSESGDDFQLRQNLKLIRMSAEELDKEIRNLHDSLSADIN